MRHVNVVEEREKTAVVCRSRKERVKKIVKSFLIITNLSGSSIHFAIGQLIVGLIFTSYSPQGCRLQLRQCDFTTTRPSNATIGKMGISVVINTRNEGEHIERVLRSVKGFASEIVVVDMHSADDTALIAKRYGAKVYTHEPLEYVEPARNFGIKRATDEWVLVLDPDEEIPTSLVKKLRSVAKKGKAEYYAIPRKNIVFGKWLHHSRWWPDYNVRFFKRGSVTWSSEIHSIPITRGKGVDLKATPQNAIVHHHYTTVEQFITRMNRYTSVQARELVNGEYKFNWKDIVHKPSSEFLSRYFAGQGYRDGLHGLAVSSLQAFSELVVYLKVWQQNGFARNELKPGSVIDELKAAQKEHNYWHADTILSQGGGIKERVKRRFRLQ